MTSIILRVAAKELAEDKMLELLAKLRKGATGSVTAKQMIAALNYLGGWTIEPVIGLKPWDDRLKPDLELAKVNSREWLEGIWQEAKKDEVTTLPSHPAKKRYTMDVSEIGPVPGYGPETIGFSYRKWFGRDAIRYISPEGKIFDSFPRDGLKPNVLDHNLNRWLYKETNLVEQVSKRLGKPTPAQEKEDRAPRTRDNTGSCPCCFGNFKLKAKSGGQLPEIVLHGFKRPGWGSVQGKCIGTSFPPFELSPEGTKHLIKVLENRTEDLNNYLKRAERGELEVLYVGTYGRKVVPGDASWADDLERAIRNTKSDIGAVAKDLKTLNKLVSEWKEQPLPEEGKSLKVWK